jgi:two-component system sensor histidine kinase/response regulator
MSYDRAGVPKADILIVDDTRTNLRLLSTMLAEQGYQVCPVLDGALALAAARAQPPDLILLDIRMPEMNGYQASWLYVPGPSPWPQPQTCRRSHLRV